MRWTKQEIEQLKKLYPTTLAKNLSNLFNRSPHAIIAQAKRTGLVAIRHYHKKSFENNPFKETKIEKICYLAGIIDGEGTISDYRKKDKYKSRDLRIAVGNTSKELIDWLYLNFGGQVTSQKKKLSHHKESWKWEIFNNNHVYHLLKMLLPFLTVKKKRAEQVINSFVTHPEKM